MPDWLINLLIQYPVATLNGLVAWYAWKQLREKEKEAQQISLEREKRNESRTDELRQELRTSAENEIKRSPETLKEANTAHLASKDSEIERLSRQLFDEMKKLGKKIEDLGKKRPE